MKLAYFAGCHLQLQNWTWCLLQSSSDPTYKHSDGWCIIADWRLPSHLNTLRCNADGRCRLPPGPCDDHPSTFATQKSWRSTMRRAITSGERTGLYSGVFLCRRPPGVDGSASEEDDRDLSSPEATDSPDQEPPELSRCAAEAGGQTCGRLTPPTSGCRRRVFQHEVRHQRGLGLLGWLLHG